MQNRIVGSLVALALTATASLAATAQAQGPGSQVEIGVFGQSTSLDKSLQINNPVALGARAGLSVYKWLGVEADMQLGNTKANRVPNETIHYTPFHGLVTLTVPMTDATALILGGGYVNSMFKGRVTANQYEDGFAGLVGLKVCGSGPWGARADGLYDYNPSPNENATTSRNLGIRLGVTYALRGACMPESTPFSWTLAMTPATATIERGASRAFALSAVDMKQRAIELRKVQNVACTSSDNGVATVDNAGTVKAVKYGTATITCSGTVKKITRSASSTVTVPPPAWSLAVAPASQTKDVGQTATFTATAKDADGVDLGAATWSSSNTSVATMSNGTATCVSGGSSTITASKTAYGSSKTATASLTCNAPPPPPPVAMVRLDSTQFDFDKATLRPAGKALLKTIIDAMKQDASLKVSVEGHTDWYGSEAYNEKLATARAKTVAKALAKLGGKAIAADRIMSKGFGEQCLLVQDGAPDQTGKRPHVTMADRAAQAPNRRVEVWQLLPTESGAPAACRTEAQRKGTVKFVFSK